MIKRLGKGLADIIDTSPDTVQAAPAIQARNAPNLVMLKLDQVRAGRYQPRTEIGAQALEELKASIKKSGVVEPVIVRPVAHGTYELVAGERRFRAAQAIGLTEIPAIVRTLADREALELSLIENIQRENLNPIEEAKGYARLLSEFSYTQESVSEAVGKDRATIANLDAAARDSAGGARGPHHLGACESDSGGSAGG
jgi:ParB family chromosome partitioning protein